MTFTRPCKRCERMFQPFTRFTFLCSRCKQMSVEERREKSIRTREGRKG